MLFVPIRYINNGEPLDQVTLNRYGFDVQENLEEIIARLNGANDVTGSVQEIPNTLALRDANGTTQFSEPIVGTNPMRLMDFSVSNVSGKGVIRGNDGGVNVQYARLGQNPINNMDAIPKKYLEDILNSFRQEINEQVNDAVSGVPQMGTRWVTKQLSSYGSVMWGEQKEYINDTGKLIFMNAVFWLNRAVASIRVNGKTVGTLASNTSTFSNHYTISAFVPPGAIYSFHQTGDERSGGWPVTVHMLL